MSVDNSAFRIDVIIKKGKTRYNKTRENIL
jgi:hypothetical protein